MIVTTSLAAPAMAADLAPAPYSKAPPPPPPAVYNWTGLYFGGHVGGAWSDETSTTLATTVLAPAGLSLATKEEGFIGGGQIGLNYQFGPWVLGIEGDGSWTNASQTVTAVSPLVPAFTISAASDINWLATLTGRFGYASGNVLVYGKGGAAWMNVDYTASVLVSGSNALFAGPTIIHDTRAGWTAGAGIEIGFWQNWSAKLEYDFLDFGSQHYAFTVGNGAGSVTTTANIDSQVHLVKAGVNYRFGWGSPLLARD